MHNVHYLRTEPNMTGAGEVKAERQSNITRRVNLCRGWVLKDRPKRPKMSQDLKSAEHDVNADSDIQTSKNQICCLPQTLLRFIIIIIIFFTQ